LTGLAHFVLSTNREADMSRTLLSVWLVLSVAASPARAQERPDRGGTAPGDTADAPTLSPGKKVRVTALQFGPDPIVGTLDGFEGDTLVLITGAFGTPGQRVTVAADSITKLEVSRGKDRELWSTLGGLAGLLLPPLIVRISMSEAEKAECKRGTLPCPQAFEALALALLGSLAGGYLGYFLAPERWTTVTLDVVTVALAPSRGVGVRVTLASPF
jgi:hypothetical protein